MKKLLIVSGDSFTDRRFRSAAHPDMDVSFPMWPELLAEKLDMRLINLGRSGQGNEYIYSVLLDYIETLEDKSQIGMVVAGWSQCFRKDFQEGIKGKWNVIGGRNQQTPEAIPKGWLAERVDPHGDVFSWVRRSLRIYRSLDYLCGRYNIPYAQTQMIPLYVDWLRGLPPTDQEIMFGGKTFEDDTLAYPGDPKEDLKKILDIIIEYDGIIDARNFLGWPISRNIGGFPLSIEVCGVVGSPYVISQYDGHPNAAGHIRLAEAIHEFIKNK